MPETDVHKQPEAQTPTIEEANKSEQAMSETKNDVHALQQNVETTGQITGQTDALKFSVQISDYDFAHKMQEEIRFFYLLFQKS